MGITVYSAFMALVWCNVFIVIVTLLRRRSGFISHFSIFPLIFLVIICIFRLLCSIELPDAIIVRSEVVFPKIIDFFNEGLLIIGHNNMAISIADILAVVWIGGGLYYIRKYIGALILLNKQLAAVGEANDPQILSIINEIRAENGQIHPVKIIKSGAVVSPMVVGFFKPTIILPDIAFSDGELKNILLHEWAHFLHKDSWTKLVMYFILSVFWWNPLIHLLNNDLDHILEIQCDLSLSSGWDDEKRIQYLESITKIIKWAHDQKLQFKTFPHAATLVSTHSFAKIEQRFHLVLNMEPSKSSYNLQNLLICGLMVLVLVFSYAFIIQPAGFPANESEYVDFYTVSPENAYLIINEDGTYSLYADDQYRFNLNQINCEPYLSLPIK